TSARILARCLNCAEGPTDTPCGVCPSCVELSRDGGGSMDVVEIDAASHGGVDDARDLRERAVFAPARDRYKIFILDEAHMVSATGFNALLKIVEEPPEHVKFIFATTEPEKVIGTIRSRTHHYPFRLVPPAQMLEYVQHLCDEESITVAPGVLPLVVRAGGGSVRDTLSLLDQLMAGSEGATVEYERAVALLGYTHGALLDEVVDSIGARDNAAAFSAIDRIIQTGQDPRRFVEDFLERLRDLIIVAATGDNASAVLRGIPQDELERMTHQAHRFGAAELSRAADVANAALTEMTGATSPRLHLELMIARILIPSSDETERGALARVERLERRVGVDGPAQGEPSSLPVSEPAGPRRLTPPAARSTPEPARTPAQQPIARSAASRSAAPTSAAAPSSAPARTPEPVSPALATPPPGGVAWTVAAIPGSPGGPAIEPDEPVADNIVEEPAEAVSAPQVEAPAKDAPAAIAVQPARTEPSAAAAATTIQDVSSPASDARPVSGVVNSVAAATTPSAEPAAATPAAAAQPIPVSLQQVRDSWPEILELVQKAKRNAWMVVSQAQARALQGDVLTLTFPNENDVANFKQAPVNGESVSEFVRMAILDVLGIRVKFIARVETTLANSGSNTRPASSNTAPATGPRQGANSQATAQPAAAQVQQANSTPPARTGQASAPARPQQGNGSQQTRPAEQGRPAQPAANQPATQQSASATRQQPTQQRPTQGAQAPSAPTQSAGRSSSAQAASPQSRTAPTRPAQGAPAQPNRPQQGSRRMSDLPDSAAPPPDDYVEPIEPDLQSDYEPGGWAVAAIPGAAEKAAQEKAAPPVVVKPALVIDPTASPTVPFGRAPAPLAPGERQRYGESVVREILGASFIEEEPVAPRVIPIRND
ncbi:MAG: polymerase subunit gamma/tau, partial [Glaciihabitans sp.]|nr:polymerase subunit gamma/tau [Glaciihabitans sp.]